MNKPWEETWEADDCVVRPTGKRQVSDDVAMFWHNEETSRTHAGARARLAAQAPAMARLLLKMFEGPVALEECPRELVDVLRAAGVLPTPIEDLSPDSIPPA